MPRLVDAHTHWEGLQDLLQRREQGIVSLLCAQTAKEYREVTACLQEHPLLRPWVLPTAGLHPWHCTQEPVEEMLKILPEVPVVGEIGMDSVWCRIPLQAQRDVFEPQLELASELGTPVILHTKGQEEAIARIIAKYPNKYLVHWYSCDSWAELYEELDCWFTIGPDVLWNETTRSLARRVKSEKILIETDGREAVKWAYQKGGILQEQSGQEGLPIRDVLRRSLTSLAQLRHEEPEELAEKTRRNAIAFLGEIGGRSALSFSEKAGKTGNVH